MKGLFPNAPVPRKRKPDPMWDALCAAFGLRPTRDECSRIGKIVRNLKEKGAEPGQIVEQLARYRAKYPDFGMPLPETLLKHWDILLADRSEVDLALEGRALSADEEVSLLAYLRKP